jgi:hypothetical protein
MKRVTVIIIVGLLTGKSLASIPVLEREVTLSLFNEKLQSALNKIQDQAGLVFSYQTSLIHDAGPISMQITRKTVREALAVILPKNIIYKVKDNYIILKEKPVEKNPKKTEVSGYVYDKTTEQKVANVTIYDKNTLQSATTDEYGYYSITVPASNPSLSVNKENYQDTVVSVEQAGASMMNFTLSPVSESVRKKDSLYWREKLEDVNEFTSMLYKKLAGYINTVNVKDTITRKFQFSVYPFIGTNHRLSGSVYNRVSFNLYGGYARGVRGFELGGLFNIDRENVTGTQVAGLFNIVGDTVKGAQVAGLFNYTGHSSVGFQTAGLINLNRGTQKGFQVGGLMNLNDHRSTGTNIAGLMNIGSTMHGVQIAGLANIEDTLLGVSVAGLFNSHNYGDQAVQIAGLFNKSAGGTSHIQIAGLFNNAKYVKGVQIATLNFADSVNGVPIGFFSYVKKGVHQLEFSADEIFYGNISFRTGVNSFYNIFSTGFGPGNSNGMLWHIGYGVGTSFKIVNKLRSDIYITSHHVSNGNFYFATSEMHRLYWGLEYKFGKKFSIAAGPTFNLYISDAIWDDYTTTYSSIVPNPFFNETDSEFYNVKAWVGGKIALRFF